MLEMWIIWLILMGAALVVEAMTLGLTTIWLAAGCLVAAILDLAGCSMTAQVVTMIVVTIITFVICLIWIKPKIDKAARNRKTATNADRFLGQEGIVIKDIDPIEGKGQVKVMGQVWSAKAVKPIPEGTKIIVKNMEGVKLLVEVANA